jgi:glutathione S-transferase
MIRLYGTPQTRSLRAAWALEELGLAYDYVPVDLMAAQAEGRPYREINPAAKVPAIVDGDLVLTESGAICTWLADRHPERGLIPAPGSPLRGRHDQWCWFALTELEQPLWTIAKHDFALPERLRLPAIQATAEVELAWALELLAEGLGASDYILGESFSVADILLGHTLHWARKRGFRLGHQNLGAYSRRLFARPAFRRAMERETSGQQSDAG